MPCHTAADEKSSSIKSEELKALDSALGGALSDIVSLHAFKGAAVSVQSGGPPRAGCQMQGSCSVKSSM